VKTRLHVRRVTINQDRSGTLRVAVATAVNTGRVYDRKGKR
jgi:hypothetical protein